MLPTSGTLLPIGGPDGAMRAFIDIGKAALQRVTAPDAKSPPIPASEDYEFVIPLSVVPNPKVLFFFFLEYILFSLTTAKGRTPQRRLHARAGLHRVFRKRDMYRRGDGRDGRAVRSRPVFRNVEAEPEQDHGRDRQDMECSDERPEIDRRHARRFAPIFFPRLRVY